MGGEADREKLEEAVHPANRYSGKVLLSKDEAQRMRVAGQQKTLNSANSAVLTTSELQRWCSKRMSGRVEAIAGLWIPAAGQGRSRIAMLFSVSGRIVSRGKNRPVTGNHVPDRSHDIAPGCGRSMTEFPRECLNSNLADRETLQHCLDGDLSANKWAVRLKVKLVDQVAPDKTKAGTNTTEPTLEKRAERAIVDPGYKDSKGGIELGITKSDDQIVPVTKTNQLLEVINIVFVVAVGKADPLVANVGETGSDSSAIAKIFRMMDHSNAGILGSQTVCDFAGAAGGRIIHDNDLVLASHARQHIEGFERNALHGALVVVNGKKDAHPGSLGKRFGLEFLDGF